MDINIRTEGLTENHTRISLRYQSSTKIEWKPSINQPTNNLRSYTWTCRFGCCLQWKRVLFTIKKSQNQPPTILWILISVNFSIPKILSNLCMSRHIIRILNDMSQNPGCEFPGYFGVVCCIHNLSPDRYKTVIKLQLSIPRWNENDTGFKMIGTIKNSFYSPITGLMHAIKTYHIMDIIEVRTYRHGARDVQIRSIPN